MVIGWIITRTHASGATEFFCEDNRWSDKPSDCRIFRNKSIAQSYLGSEFLNNDTDEIVPVEAYY
jgi:hypothetical protein